MRRALRNSSLPIVWKSQTEIKDVEEVTQSIQTLMDHSILTTGLVMNSIRVKNHPHKKKPQFYSTNYYLYAGVRLYS